MEFVLFGGSVGAVIFIHVTYGALGIQEILTQVGLTKRYDNIMYRLPV